MNLTIRRSLEFLALVGMYAGAVLYIETWNPRRTTPTPIQITDIRATISENDHAPAAIDELPDEPVPAVPRSRDPEPPAPVAAAAKPVEPEPAKPAARQPASHSQPIPQQPQQWQCQPVCQPEPACRRHGIGGLFQWLSPFSDN